MRTGWSYQKAKSYVVIGHATAPAVTTPLLHSPPRIYNPLVRCSFNQAFHQTDVTPILEKNFRVVHVDIGDDGKKNNDLATEYKIPLEKGVPALAILDPDGKLLYSQKNGEWESARSLDPDDVITFLNKWKP